MSLTQESDTLEPALRRSRHKTNSYFDLCIERGGLSQNVDPHAL